jgi:ATP-dependent DNA ligase
LKVIVRTRNSAKRRHKRLALVLRKPRRFVQRYSGDGAIIYKHACALGCEGIVSKRLGSTYRSGRVVSWLKVKDPAAPAVTREADEEWN